MRLYTVALLVGKYSTPRRPGIPSLGDVRGVEQFRFGESKGVCT